MKRLLLGLLLLPSIAVAQQVVPPIGTAALVCAYNSSPPTLTSGTFGYVQCDQNGNLILKGAAVLPSPGTVGDLVVVGPATSGVQDASALATYATMPVGIQFTATPQAYQILLADGFSGFNSAGQLALASTSLVYLAGAGTTANPVLTFGNCGTNCGWLAPAASQLEVVVGGANVLDYGVSDVGWWRLTPTNGVKFAGSGVIFTASSATIQLRNTGTIISSPANTVLHLGAIDAASPVAQTLGVQGVVAGNANTAAANFTISGGLSNGSGGGDMIFVTTLSNASSGVQNTAATALTLKGGTQAANFAAQVNVPNMTTSSVAQTGTVCWTTGTGALTADTTVGCLTSLEELKDIEGPIVDALGLVAKLRPFWYQWKDDTAQHAGDTHTQPGFGAHQVESVDPRLATYSMDGSLHGVRYQQLTAVLTAAIQELQSEIESLKRKTAWIDSTPPSWRASPSLPRTHRTVQ